jgi:hypothetical protein
MTSANWTTDELDRIDATDEIEIASRRPDGTFLAPVRVWVVRVGDELYVRSWRGTGGRWFRVVRETGEGRISAAGLDRDVAFAGVSGAEDDAVDAAYRAKYGRYDVVTEMIDPPAHDTTMRLVRRG